MSVGTRTVDVACLAGLVAVVVLGTFAGIKSAHAMRTRVQRHNEAVAQRTTELKTVQAVSARLDAALHANEQALTRLQERLPDADTTGEFLGELDAVMARNKVDLSEMKPGAPVAELHCVRTPLQIACRGGFAGLHAVFYEIETMQRLVRINRVSIRCDSLDGTCFADASCSLYGR